MQYFRRRMESLSQDPNSSKQDLYSYQTGRKEVS
jgi:hypothetical protein